MAAGTLDQLVGGNFDQDAKKIIEFRQELRGLVADFKEANDAAKRNEGFVAQSSGLEQTVKASKALVDAQGQLIGTSSKLSATLAEAANVKARYNGSTKDVLDTSQKLIRLTKEEAVSQDALNKSIASGEVARKKAIETQIAENKLKESASSLRQREMREEQTRQKLASQGAQKQLGEYDLLRKAYNDQANAAKELGVQEYKRLGIAGLASEKFLKAAAEAKKMYEVLYAVESAVGQNQRGVGQYERGRNAQLDLAVQRILQEAPSAVNSLNTFFLAISNNLPELFTQIGKINAALAKANSLAQEQAIAARAAAEAQALQAGATKEAAIAQGVLAEEAVLLNANLTKAPGAFKQVMNSLLSWNTLLNVGVLLLTLYGGKFIDWVGKIFKGKSALDKLTEAEKNAYELREKVAESYGKEISSLELLRRKIQDVNLPMADRLQGVRDIQALLPQYFGQLDKEALLAGKIGDAYERASQAILASARVRTYSDKLGGLEGKIAEFQERIQREASTRGIELNRFPAALPGREAGFQLPASSPIYKTGAKDDKGKPVTSNLIKDIIQFNKLLEQRYDLLDKINKNAPKAATATSAGDAAAQPGSVADLRNQIAELERRIDTEQKGSKEQIADTKKLIELRRQLKAIVGTPAKGKAAPDLTTENIQADRDLIKERYETYKRGAQIVAEIQDGIAKDENRSFDERIGALKIFVRERLRVLNLEYTAEVQEAQLQLTKIAEFERIPVAKRTKEQNDQIRQKSIVQKKLQNLELAYIQEINSTVSRGAADNLKITQAAEEEKYNTILEILKKTEQSYNESFAVRKAQLDQQLKDNLISQRQYDKALKTLTNDSAREIYQAQIDALEQLGDVFDKGSVEGEKFADALAKIKKLLGEVKETANKDFALGLSEDDLKKTEDRTQRVAAAFQNVANVVSNLAQRRAAELDSEIEAINKKRDAEISAINAAAYSEEEKARRTAEAQAKADAQASVLQEQKKQRMQRAAQLEKAVTVAQIIAETALATVRALGSKPYTPANIAFAAATAAAGAAQLAVAISAPLPQYAEGTDDHPGGKAIIAEGNKRELVREKSGRWWMAEKEGVYEPGKHAQVFPHVETESMLRIAAMYTMGVPAMIPQNSGQGMDLTPVTKKLDGVLNAIKASPQTAVSITGKGITHFVLKGSSSVQYVKNV